MDPVPLGDLESQLGYSFRDAELAAAALTHRSFAHEAGNLSHSERLEFLGDAVLGLIAAEWLFRTFPGRPEGELSRGKAYLVSAHALAAYAERLELGKRLRLGVGEARSGGHAKESLLADALEALFGAVYLDGAMSAARLVVESYLAASFPADGVVPASDPKTELQEKVQGRGWEIPIYRVASEQGPDHRKTFEVECLVQGEVMGTGTGRSKKQAEQAAAAATLAHLASRAESDPS